MEEEVPKKEDDSEDIKCDEQIEDKIQASIKNDEKQEVVEEPKESKDFKEDR
jgi:hypothetical protein